MLVQLYMYGNCTGRHERLSGKLCWSSSTCMDTVQTNTNTYRANYAGRALHVWTLYRQTGTPVRQIMLVQLYIYGHCTSTGRHKRLSGKLCWSSSTCMGTVQADSNACQANYASPALHVWALYRQTRTPVRQIMLVQLYMYGHRTDKHEHLSGNLCWSSSTCMNTVQADTNPCQSNYAGPALHVWTPYRQTRTPVGQLMLVQLYMYGHCTGRQERLSGKLCWSSSTCMDTVQANTNTCQPNYTGQALCSYTIQVDSNVKLQRFLNLRYWSTGGET
jgi:hypothetical protein